MTLARYDRIALAERRRRYVISNFSFGSGCRCCYDPKLDGGEYAALAEARLQLEEEEQDKEEEEEPWNDKLQSKKENAQEEQEEDSDNEYDYLLEENDIMDEGIQKMEEERRAEMYLTALISESATYHGYGVHRQIHPQYIVRATGLGSVQQSSTTTPAVVLHLFEETNPLSASLDLYLEKMAPHYQGTKFIRCNGRLSLIWNPKVAQDLFPPLLSNRSTLDVDAFDRYLPCLLAIQGGQVVSSCYHLDGLGSMKLGGIDPSMVENWLSHTGVLHTQYTVALEEFCRYRPEEEALHENMIRAAERMKEDGKQDIYPCGMAGCEKTFPHEHIGYQTQEQKGLLVNAEQIIGIEK
jgi:hypothetical protein